MAVSRGYEEKRVIGAVESDSRPRRGISQDAHCTEVPGDELETETQLPPPPDGGLHAWLKVFGGLLCYINIWGFTLAYGAFQSYYEANMLSSSSASSISWIGTVQGWLLILVGVLSGPLFDIGYFRPMLYLGNFLVVLGVMMLSLSKTYWQVFLSQGVCMGLGAGLLYIPSLALVGIWFERKRALALGIVLSGNALGGVVYVEVFNRMLPAVGFPWTIRAMGFIALFAALLSSPALLSGSSILARPRKARALFDPSALKDKLFYLFTASCFFVSLGYMVPFFYIPTYATAKLGTSSDFGSNLLVTSISASFFGRIASGFVAQRVGSIVTWVLCTVSCCILAFSWISIETKGAFIVFSIFWGFFSSGLVTLPTAAFPTITPDLSRLGTRLGMSWGVASIATLIGSPVAGALLTTRHKDVDFIGVQVWSGVVLMVGAIWVGILWTVTAKTLNKGWRV